MFNYVVDTNDQEFIFKFAKQANVGKSTLLAALHQKKSPEMIEEAFKVFKFSQDDLKWVASEPELMCSPDNLFNLLGKIEKHGDQEEAIDDGVENLFEGKRTECLEPLLHALEGKESFRHLKDVAIKKAFMEGSYHGNKPIVERFHDHPAVSVEDYAYGLIYSGKRSTQDPNFIFLLGEADQDDLNAVKKHDLYESRSDEFKKVIEDALVIAKPGGTRSTLPFQRAELVMTTFNEDSNMRIPTVISQLIAFYLVDESIPKSTIRLVKYVKEVFENDLMVEVPTVPSELIASYLIDKFTSGLWDSPGKQSKALTSNGGTDEDKNRSLSTAFNDLTRMAMSLQASDNDDE